MIARGFLIACVLSSTACGARTAVDMTDPPDPVLDAGRDAGRDAGIDAPLPTDVPPRCTREVSVSFTPTARAQFAVWTDVPSGFATIALTEATAYRGIGNRPGALQMNSGYHWPLGRRENVLPGWASARLASGAPGFRTVVFSDRDSEGFASRGTSASPWGSSPDAYFCLPYDVSLTQRDGLDAVTCASLLSHNKGRFLTEADVAAGYAEPFLGDDGRAFFRALELTSPYPPRRDVSATGLDHPDVGRFAAHAREVMPELDAVTMATPAEGERVTLRWTVPAGVHGGISIHVEVNTEGDYFGPYDPTTLPTPTEPAGGWDSWSQAWGYPYRGQPSVVFETSLALPGETPGTPPVGTSIVAPSRRGTLDGSMIMEPMDATIVDDPAGHPGSGADRLSLIDGARVAIEITTLCE
jgi:hypothetical protein